MPPRDDMSEPDGDRAPPTRFPGERRTTAGRFTGFDDRLVHVAPDGSIRDFGYPLSGLTGIRSSGFGIRSAPDADVAWFADCEHEQAYLGDSCLVETVHRAPIGTVRQLDLAVGQAQLSAFVAPDAPDGATIVANVALAPDGRTAQVAQLRFSDAIEVYHADEHDYVTSTTGLSRLHAGGQPADADRGLTSTDRGEEDTLTGDVRVALPLEDGTTTLVTLLTDATETDREAAAARLGDLASTFRTPAALERHAAEQYPVNDANESATDLRILALLSADAGLRMAGPDFDPSFQYSGGYGYTWFRDDAEIARYLLSVDEGLAVDLDRWHRRSARMYCRTQLADGSWPHRVWPWDGSLAPGWANGRIESIDLLGRGADPRDETCAYQADQTASVIAFLAALRPALQADGLSASVDASLHRGIRALDDTLGEDGRPIVCQNAWEDASGRFTHTAATFLEGYATVGTMAPRPVGDGERDLGPHAGEQARRVYAALDDLWVSDGGHYGMRETTDGSLDERVDSATFALVSAHRAYEELEEVDDRRLDRLVSHVETAIERLWREEGTVAGLVRYEGDEWRRGAQEAEKVWTVSTVWGAHAAAELAVLLAARGDDRAEAFATRARSLLALVSPGGPLCESTGYLPEQYFDDGTPDSATPLGWSHALRLATRTRVETHDLLATAVASSDD